MGSTVPSVEENKIAAAFADFNDAVEEAANENTVSLALDIYRRVTFRNRFLSGRSRASWNLSVNEIDDSVQPEGLAVYPQKTVSSLSIAPWSLVYITNNLPYILKLEGLDAMLETSVEEVAQRARTGF